MAGSQISTSVSIIDSLSGFMALSLTEYNTSAAAAIAAGSKVEIAGAFFQFPADETPTGWTAITTGTTAYIALTASGTAGSQVVNAGYVSTAPTWRDDLHGWYASAASSVRIVASVYKAESTSYYPKFIMPIAQEGSQRSINANTASISSSFAVGDVATFSSSITVTGKAYLENGINVRAGIIGSSITYGSIYTALNTYIPTSGDSMILHGGINGAPCYYANRSSTTTISCFYNTAASALGVIATTSGGASIVTSISVVW